MSQPSSFSKLPGSTNAFNEADSVGKRKCHFDNFNFTARRMFLVFASFLYYSHYIFTIFFHPQNPHSPLSISFAFYYCGGHSSLPSSSGILPDSITEQSSRPAQPYQADNSCFASPQSQHSISISQNFPFRARPCLGILTLHFPSLEVRRINPCTEQVIPKYLYSIYLVARHHGPISRLLRLGQRVTSPLLLSQYIIFYLYPSPSSSSSSSHIQHHVSHQIPKSYYST